MELINIYIYIYIIYIHIYIYIYIMYIYICILYTMQVLPFSVEGDNFKLIMFLVKKDF